MKHIRCVEHVDGRVSTFFRLCGGYLELCTDDEHPADPCSIWLCSTDLPRALQCAQVVGGEPLHIVEQAPTGDDEPAWLIAHLPTFRQDGASVSLIQYLRGTGADLSPRMPQNGLFAIIGVSLRTEQPEQERLHYLSSLGTLEGITPSDHGRFFIGHQWLDFSGHLGLDYDGPLRLDRACCQVHMATVDLDRTVSMLTDAEFVVDRVPGMGVVAQLQCVPTLCLVLRTGLDPAWHRLQLLARNRL
ncbi:hypothetical protein IAE35_21610 [Pseudomonas sp. S75]|uniref:hypothetical protein n=1 Tax=unclassified Pseudomonas TaxID=196821 RepID=UPI001903E1AA|nr:MULTISPECIES: hypothetical protein [unclassified Pseudomonas]MBJ9978114.1 hypothetical protein [Pseudomonas sp. S30]MBK0155945.1 hypothetical protein [Pseudomonas sp. S75]